ncbi:MULTISPECIES: hypothetical protein [unclassified Nostoc]|uniref:hypothetical protein n=1 Tax=unclassified Nostoc TaxID=2593658 RepID=UPI001D14CBE3|nr:MULTISPECIES: hypothetical protein [unclassified Nostoc]
MATLLKFNPCKVKEFFIVSADGKNMDMLIASHALSLGVTLVTNNVREFSRISTLLLENWVEYL